VKLFGTLHVSIKERSQEDEPGGIPKPWHGLVFPVKKNKKGGPARRLCSQEEGHTLKRGAWGERKNQRDARGARRSLDRRVGTLGWAEQRGGRDLLYGEKKER